MFCSAHASYTCDNDEHTGTVGKEMGAWISIFLPAGGGEEEEEEREALLQLLV